jgi:hypothetical protein
MRGIHHMLIHVPLGLWLLAAGMILLRAFSAGKLARAAEGALLPVVVLGLLGGAASIVSGFFIWSWEAALYSPLTRNHILLSVWSMGIWGVVLALLVRGGSAVWEGFGSRIMAALALVALLLLTVTGTTGGKIAGIPSLLYEPLDRMGLNIYGTFYLPWFSIALLVILGVLMALGGRRKA